jgi:hypothetical protein
MVTTSERKRDFLIDIIARMAQIVFAVLIVGPFVNNYNVWYIIIGFVVLIGLLFLGLLFSTGNKEG